MNSHDKLLWRKTRWMSGKRTTNKLNLNNEDLETFIQNWEDNVFARNDNFDADETITRRRDRKLDLVYWRF